MSQSDSTNILFYLQVSGLLLLIIGGILGLEFYKGQKPADVTLASIQREPEKGEDIFACEKDLDCIAVPEKCCNCDEGGARKAINRQFLTHTLNTQQDECIFTACPQRISDDHTCKKAEPQCEAGSCVMK